MRHYEVVAPPEATIDNIKAAAEAYLNERGLYGPRPCSLVFDQALQSAIRSNNGSRSFAFLAQTTAYKALFAGACLEPHANDKQRDLLKGWNELVAFKVTKGSAPFQCSSLLVRCTRHASDRPAAIFIDAPPMDGGDADGRYWLGEVGFKPGAEFSTENQLLRNSYLATIPGRLSTDILHANLDIDLMCWVHLVRPEDGVCEADWDRSDDCYADMPPPNRPQHAPSISRDNREYRPFKKWLVLVYEGQAHIFCDATWLQKVSVKDVEEQVVRFMTAKGFRKNYI